MSLISDALQKAQQEREPQRTVSTVSYPPRARSTSRTDARSPTRGGWSFTLLLAAACIAIVFFAFRARWLPFLARPSAPPVALAASPAVRETGATVAPPPPAVVPAAAASAEPISTDDYELAGVGSLGAKTLLSVSRRRDRRNFWIPVGQSAGGIAVVSYQPETDRAVIRVHDRLLRISLRDGPAEPLPASATAE
jgi:hypothetical protein